MFTGMFVKVGAAVVIAVAIAAVLVFQGSDTDEEGTQPAAEPTATVAPANTPGPTPIAALTVPGVLPAFEELEFVPVGYDLHGDNFTDPVGDGLYSRGEVVARERTWRTKFDGRRLKLLVYAPGVDPMEQDGSALSIDDEGVMAVAPGQQANWPADTSSGDKLYAPLLFSLNDERLIVVEEFAFCGDGRGIYLEHSTKPVEVGETFAYEIYVDPDDPISDIHMVLIAAPDSPITHDGPDPKRADIKWTPVKDVLTADAGVAIIGIIADGGPQIREMCAN